MECFENNRDGGERSRRSKIVKNLEQEVELILSQEESDDDVFVEDAVTDILPRTPSRFDKAKEISAPRGSQGVLQDMLQTPRRSCRKSIKPTQDYDDIVSKSCSRSNRTMNKPLLITKEEENEDDSVPAAQPKWTPAKVGRVSQKRSRKLRRNTKAKQKQIKEQNVIEELEICPEIEVDVKLQETENLVNINTKIEGNIILAQPPDNTKIEEKLENVMKTAVLNKQLNSVGNPRESLKEFMEIEKHINNLQLHNVPIPLYQEDLKDMSSEKINNVSIQEDSEDVKELPLFPKIENNCEQLVEENSNKSITNEQFEDSFGCYLKSKEINISDLGLNPLNDDDQDFVEKQKIEDAEINSIVVTNELDEMPSLIVCDDDEEEEVTNVEANQQSETFDANDSVVIIEKTSKLWLTSSQDVMESLKMSDDESDTPKKAPRIMLTTTELKNQTLLATPYQTSTLKPSTPKLPSTSHQSGKAFKFPTPYRNRHNFKFNKSEQSVEKNELKNIMNCSWMSSVTSLEPKDIVLRGIRKRSLSVCIDGNEVIRPKPLANSEAKHRNDRMVSFYSPANQTSFIDDLDMCIAKSLKKQKKVDAESSNKFVTTRRKRSMSVDESLISSSMLMSRLPRPVPVHNTLSKSQTLLTSSSKPLTRTKLPNFAAIHNKNFQKMENLVDHVNRKQERLKSFINSNTKIKPVSAQKNISLIKIGNNIEKPKALKKIDLGVSSSRIPSKNIIATNTTFTTIADTIKSQENLTKTRTLPHPHSGVIKKVIKTGVIPQRIPHNFDKQKAPSSAQQQQIRKYLKPSQIINNNTVNRLPAASTSTVVNHKSNFNLSTAIPKPCSTSSSMENLNKVQTTSNDDKMASRLQRHMDLFKGRVPATRSGVASRKNDEVIRGVRSNRRFELQMKHRKNMEN